jgi:isopentenyl diphosphate isomerase/L-lactate dehydrogenase-like FMN-dependent dehydrogenase
MGLRDLRKIMRQKVPAEAWEHFNGAAESKATFRRNPQAFSQYLFRQKIFTTFPNPTSPSSYLHDRADSGDYGARRKLLPDRERCRARGCEGCDRAGAMMFVSQAAKFGPKEWRNADKSPLVFMAYMNRGKDEVSAHAKLAEDLGFAAVGITVDTVSPGKDRR